MVGVPGRSKACNTCKQRRIACGLERPQCAQCIKSNRVCGGYQRERIWVPSNATVEDTLKTLAAQKSSHDSVKYSKPSTTNTKKKKSSAITSSSTSTSSSSESTSTTSANQTPYQSSPAGTLIPSPTATAISQTPAYKHQILSDFLSSYIPIPTSYTPRNGNTPSPPPPPSLSNQATDTAGTWLLLLAELPTWTTALETSLLSVCIAKLGRVYNNPVLIKESLRMYGRGLWEVQKALWDPKLMYRDETLAACLALTMYETIECPEGSGIAWLTHTGGCARLVEVRGPKAHREKLGHALFRAIRWTTILQSLTLQRPSFLSTTPWLTTPWPDPSTKPLIDRLLDCYALGVSINATAYGLSSSTDPSILISEGMSIIKGCWSMDTQLQSLFAELKATTLGPIYWPEFSKLDNPADDEVNGKVFPVALWFPDMQVAVFCVLYWTLLVILYSGMVAMYKVIETLPRPDGEAPVEVDGSSEEPEEKTPPSSGAADSSSASTSTAPTPSPPHPLLLALPPLGYRADIFAHCRPICESAEYFLQADMRAMGPSTVAFPIQVVIANLKIRPERARELAWCEATVQQIVGRGFKILEVEEMGGVRVKDLEAAERRARELGMEMGMQGVEC